MRHRFETTAVSSEAGLLSGLTLGAAVAIDTLRIIAVQSKAARGHASNGGQDVKFLSGQFAVVVMIAILFVWALPEQKVIIAKLKLLQPVQIIARNTLKVETINALAVFVAFHGLRGSCTQWLRTNNLEVGRIRNLIGCRRRQGDTQA